jgi:hypothetical protein
MKANSNIPTFGKVFASIAIVSLTLSPGFSMARDGSRDASAQSSTETSTSNTSGSTRTTTDTSRSGETETSGDHKAAFAKLNASTGKNFCNRFNDIDNKLNTEETTRIGKVESEHTKAEQEVTKNRGDRTTKLAELRAKWDAQRKERYAKLEAKATTDAQKAAVTAFEATVDQAVATRRAAVDAAIATYQTQIDAARSTRNDQIKVAMTTFKAAVKAAQDQAKASCSAGTDPATVRQTFTAALDSARANLKTAIANADKVKTDIQPLTDARNAAVKAANDAFHTTVQAAAVTLKAAFQ